jgi:hypothetical protein
MDHDVAIAAGSINPQWSTYDFRTSSLPEDLVSVFVEIGKM